MNITLVLPTKDRPHYVERLLKYYLSLGFLGDILILDSSNKENADYIKTYISNIGKLNCNYIHGIGLPSVVIKENLDHIKTKYVSFIGDDDYLIPSGILNSIVFLEKHTEIVACRGEGMVLSDTDITAESIGAYSQVHRMENSASDRLVQHFSNYGTPFFHVCRLHIFKKAYSMLPSISMKSRYGRLIGDELLVSALMLVYGKFTSIDGLHVVRIHSKEKNKLRESWSDDTQTKDKQVAVRSFTEKVAKEIQREDLITYLEAEKIAIKSLEFMIDQDNKVSAENKAYVRDFRNKSKQFMRSFLYFLKLFEVFVFIKNKIFVNNKRLGLINILNIDSFYHEDFIPVYSSLVTYKKYNSIKNLDSGKFDSLENI